MPLFSVIVTTDNRPQYLLEAIASVLAQDLEDYEVLVVDDGSTPPAVLAAPIRGSTSFEGGRQVVRLPRAMPG